MNVELEVVRVLEEVLSLGGRGSNFTRATHLLGAVPELDSMAVVSIIGTLEERLGITVDDDDKRLVEEFVLTIKNTRKVPVDVVLREHLYRGQNWTLAYQTAREPTKEGPQQISLRTTVPASGEGKVLYVVVYTWP